VEELCAAGLDSMRVSLNSARKALYDAYYRPTDYSFDDVKESIRVARRRGVFVSLNYFVFPGVTDQEAEILALLELLADTRPNYIQMRNLNMDPDLYLATVGRPERPGVGVDRVLEMVHARFPSIRFGYFNPPKEGWGKAGTVPPEHRELSVRHEEGRAEVPAGARAFQDSGE
jgi:hypothetical protein